MRPCEALRDAVRRVAEEMLDENKPQPYSDQFVSLPYYGGRLLGILDTVDRLESSIGEDGE
jgi:hypothetical protein